MMRIGWATAGSVSSRGFVLATPSMGLRCIGVDELRYRRHREYVTVVVDHERAAVVWAREDKDTAKLFDWIGWAARPRLLPFRGVARTIKQHIERIVAYVATGLSSPRSEGLNGKIRTITRRSFGFHSASNLIALIHLCCGGLTLSSTLK